MYLKHYHYTINNKIDLIILFFLLQIMQTNLNSFFDKSKTVYNIFYINWINEFPNTYWDVKKSSEYTFNKNIKWKKIGVDVSLVGNIENNPTKMTENYKHTSLLKSNLQKCIRRGLVDKSVSTAKLMIKTDFIQFIRRLFIIILEDTTLHHSVCPIMWMTAAYPEWQPCQKHINWLLSLVKYLAENKLRDIYLKTEFDFMKNIEKINKLPSDDKNILYCLYLRTSYGGMKGDIDMIHYLIQIWIERFIEKKYYSVYDKFKLIDYKPKNIKINEILLEAVDFHCYPKLIELIKRKHINIDKEDIKKSIWYFSSSYNIRKIIDSNLTDFEIEKKQFLNTWNIIEEDVVKYSKKYLQNL